MMQDMATGSKEKEAQLYKVLVIGDYAVGTPRIHRGGPGAPFSCLTTPPSASPSCWVLRRWLGLARQGGWADAVAADAPRSASR